MTYLRSFAHFWWDFIVGDDWRIAAGIAVALATTGLLTNYGVGAWWLLPLAVALLLGRSLRRQPVKASDNEARELTRGADD